MKRSFVWILLSYSALGITGISVRAQEIRPEKETLVVEPGNDFRAALEKGVRLKAVGQPIRAKLLEPVYAGETLAIPAGSHRQCPRLPLGASASFLRMWQMCVLSKFELPSS